MGLRTAKQYKDSLRDGREVYAAGEKVTDVTTHNILQITVEHSAVVFDLAFDTELRELFTFTSPETNQVVSSYYHVPGNSTDLANRNRLIEETTKRCRSTLDIIKAIGSDGLFALSIIGQVMDRKSKSDYYPRVQKYLSYCRENDLALALAQTDVKGDRKLRPHQQPDPDMYVHVAQRDTDGIVVRGAKAHTTGAPAANEIIVIPTRAMGEEDKDYAVAFAVPANTEGLKLICRTTGSIEQNVFDYPVSRRNIETETLTIFDDVFVPWDRVFMCGEWQYAGALATTFANFHRFTAISYKPPLGDVFVGAAQLIAEYNGVADASHIREKIARLIQYTELTRACAKSAALECHLHETGIAIPNTVLTNVGKYHFASQFHEATRLLQDIAGGLVITAPSEKDVKNPATRKYIEKYLVGAKETTAEDRLKVFNLIRDLTASEFGGYNLVVSLHGEGSLEAQSITTYRDYDIQRCKNLVKDILNIQHN